ncbi:unnamed protein product [Urochloa decumbens]|uniref:Uncharacterized protein n=1 Tax=Urochloa decumbens TaxID=240449 RepID=A0ABC9H8S0_9POAL
METMGSLGVQRRHGAAEAREGSAKKIKMVKAAVGYEAPPVERAPAKKKTKKVMKAVSQDQVDFVLAAKPTIRTRLPQDMQARRITEERRRQSAAVDEIVRCNNEILRRLQADYRHQIDTKGCVHVEVDVTDDES